MEVSTGEQVDSTPRILTDEELESVHTIIENCMYIVETKNLSQHEAYLLADARRPSICANSTPSWEHIIRSYLYALENPSSSHETENNVDGQEELHGLNTQAHSDVGNATSTRPDPISAFCENGVASVNASPHRTVNALTQTSTGEKVETQVDTQTGKQGIPPHPTKNGSTPIPDEKKTLKQSGPSNLELIQKTIGNLQAGGRVAKTISKRDALTLNPSKKGRKGKKAYVCPGRDKCTSAFCSHPYDTDRLVREKVTHMVDAIKKKIQKDDDMVLSVNYIDRMLFEKQDLLLPTIKAIREDILKREIELMANGRVSLTYDSEIRKYSYNDVFQRNLFTHFEMSSSSTHDEFLAGAEMHNARLLDFASKGKNSWYGKDLERRKRDAPSTNGTMVLYQIEARLMSERAGTYSEAIAKGEKGDVLEKTMRRFHEGIPKMEWIDEMICGILPNGQAKNKTSRPTESLAGRVGSGSLYEDDEDEDGDGDIVDGGSNLDQKRSPVEDSSDSSSDTSSAPEEESSRRTRKMEREPNYAIDCMLMEKDMEDILWNAGPFLNERSSDERIKALVAADKDCPMPPEGVSMSTYKFQRARELCDTRNELSDFHYNRVDQVCEQIDRDMKEQWEWLQSRRAQEVADREEEGKKDAEMVHTIWKEIFEKFMASAD